MALVKISMNINEDLKNWYEEKAKETGISRTALMSMALTNYMDSKKALSETGSIAKLVEQLEKVLEGQNYE